MMAYDRQFVLAVLHNGSPVREINGKVTIPFHSEYKIRLKNKNSDLRAKACVWVDGRKVSNLGDFILNPGETLDLERFLTESMESGRRFKFVPLSDSRVNDPTDEENGIIRVDFYREKGSFNWFKLNYKDPVYPLYKLNMGPNRSNDYSTLKYGTIVITNLSQQGATVEGGRSDQKFIKGSDFETDLFPITLTLRIQAPEEDDLRKTKGPKKSTQVRFCPRCGARRMRKAKFCHRCGERYPKRLGKT
ncbi:MAG: hypothetical protein GF334_01450 [Candidatus Altiarchaeales archaeon]|nr:hypothetical protein [Candidatus Altiarchaeales archaeon]